LSRSIYLDESGISVNESVTVVAGVIVNDDLQWENVERQIEELISEYVLPENQNGFVFHAKDLFFGSGKVFGDRNKYPPERSREALKRLLGITVKAGLPIVCGHLKKWPVTRLSKQGRRDQAAKSQMMAFSLCAVAAEKYMRETAGLSEIGTLVAENNNDTRRAIKFMHNLLRGRDPIASWSSQGMFSLLSEMAPGCLPMRRIKDTVYFAEKDDAILLQIADACAFILRYFYEKKPHIDEFLDAVTNCNRTALGNPDNAMGYLAIGQ
jgi:hypothetical protein